MMWSLKVKSVCIPESLTANLIFVQVMDETNSPLTTTTMLERTQNQSETNTQLILNLYLWPFNVKRYLEERDREGLLGIVWLIV
jgi:hypothetical protein